MESSNVESSCSTTSAKFSCTNEGQRSDSLNPNHSSRHLKQTENIGLSGAKVYIYLSGSRLAQRFIYGYINYGNLRKYLCGFFDTRVGRNKRETQIYNEISKSLGVDKPSNILFETDVIQEAVATNGAV
ncbi:putative HAD superfamily protein [Helianthus annuus]|uniref:HAD superfamily protein n=1 Tax=Helianthus annuus TaxID=4232 RepID=A0A9K3DNX3_HELAN|nr:putative HAD superfamily protein [Helianthus annuus]